MKKLVLVSVTTLGILGCSFPMEQVGLFKTGAKLPEVSVFSGDPTPITFNVVLERPLKTCAQCHKEEFNTAAKVLRNQNNILDRVNRTGAGVMPPANRGLKALTDCEKQILVTWLDDQKVGRASPKVNELAACGKAPSEEVKPTPTPPAEVVDFANLEVSFANLQKYILEPKCLRCHTPQAKDKEEGKVRTSLMSESEIQAQGLLDTTIEKAVLYQVVMPGLNKRFMPPVRSGLPALTEPEVDYLKRWILSVPQNDWF